MSAASTCTAVTSTHLCAKDRHERRGTPIARKRQRCGADTARVRKRQQRLLRDPGQADGFGQRANKQA
jgi:hypothetical protein